MATVESIMSRTLLTGETTTALTEAAQEMHSHAVGAVLVLAGGRLEGILTERDILRAVATGSVEGNRGAASVARGPAAIGRTDTTGHAASLMIHGGFRHLPVVDSGEPVGIVSIRDL